MAPAAPPPFAIYHLSSFNSNVGALAAAIAARTGACIAASNHGTASKDVLGFSLNNSLFARTYSFTVRGSLATAIIRENGDMKRGDSERPSMPSHAGQLGRS